MSKHLYPNLFAILSQIFDKLKHLVVRLNPLYPPAPVPLHSFINDSADETALAEGREMT